MSAAQPIVRIAPLGFPWETIDPFLFCVHHDDAYPKGNARLGPDAPLAGRDLGQDFSRKDGWSMYHGREVPGFPGHPHRGFETVTIVRKGRDRPLRFARRDRALRRRRRAVADRRQGHRSRACRDVPAARPGGGQTFHAELLPLARGAASACPDRALPAARLPGYCDRAALELFQIWLNLPAIAAKQRWRRPHFERCSGRDRARARGAGATSILVAGRATTAARTDRGRRPRPPARFIRRASPARHPAWTACVEQRLPRPTLRASPRRTDRHAAAAGAPPACDAGARRRRSPRARCRLSPSEPRAARRSDWSTASCRQRRGRRDEEAPAGSRPISTARRCSARPMRAPRCRCWSWSTATRTSPSSSRATFADYRRTPVSARPLAVEGRRAGSCTAATRPASPATATAARSGRR